MNFKIAHVITTIERGGAEIAVLNLAKLQSNYRDDVTIFPLKGSLDLLPEFTSANVNVDYSFINYPLPIQILFMWRKLKKFDLVHAHLPRAELVAFLSTWNTPLVITRHNAEPFFPGAPNWLSRLMSSAVTGKAKKIIAISEAVKSYLLTTGEVRDKHKTSTIYYGYEPRIKPPTKNKNHGCIRIGTISRLVPQKNLSLLIHITKRAFEMDLNICTFIAGDGGQKTALKRLSKDLGIEDRVEFVGRIKDGVRFISNLDFFFLTSNYEGFGLALLEAMDAQVPIIASQISAIPEVLGESHPGLISTPSAEIFLERLISLLKNPSLREKFLNYQNRQLAKFGVSKYLQEHHQLYSQVLAAENRNR